VIVLAIFRAAAMAWSMFWYLYVPSLPANVTLGFLKYLLECLLECL
jgi:hypothetical protein